MEQEKNTLILMKDNKQSTLFFYKNNFKRTMRFTGKYEQNKSI